MGPSPAPAIRAVVADDHPLVREALAGLLSAQADISVVATAGTPEATFAAVAQHQPDVLVLDVAMPESVIPDLPALIAVSSGTRVLMVTGNEDWRTARQALDAGALGYQLKTAEPAELVRSVRSVALGGSYVHPEIGASLARTPVLPDGLTGREVEILCLLATGHTNRETGERVHLSVRTVEAYRARIQLKTGRSSRADLVRYVADHHLEPTAP